MARKPSGVKAVAAAPAAKAKPATETALRLRDDERLLLDVIDALRGAENLRDRVLMTLQSGTPAVADLAYAVKARVKEDYKAIEKIKDRRAGAPDRPPKPDYGAGNVTDLIGVRIVTLYRLDVLDVLDALIATINADPSPSAAFVQNSISEVIIYSTNPMGDVQGLPAKVKSLFEGYELGAVTRIAEKPSNYSSIHIVLQGRGKYRESYRVLPIEIQVRTALEDVWGQIEHSLKYKRKRLSEADGQSRESQRLTTTLNHLGALKTMIDGIAQYGDQIKVQIDELEPEVRSTASKEAEEVDARLKGLKDVPAELKAEIAAAVAAGKPGLAGTNLALQVRDRVLRSSLVRLDALAEQTEGMTGLSVKSQKELRYILTMQRALIQFQLGNLRPSYAKYLTQALMLLSDLERDYPARLVIAYRLARTLDALGLRSDAIAKLREMVDQLQSGGLLPPHHWIRSAAPRILGVFLWEEARSLNEAGDRGVAVKLLHEACMLSRDAYAKDVLDDPTAATGIAERTKAANNLLYFMLEYLEMGGEETASICRDELSGFLAEIGGDAPSAIVMLSAADTARRAHAYLGNRDLARQAARTVLNLVGADVARTPSVKEAIRAAERTLAQLPDGEGGA